MLKRAAEASIARTRALRHPRVEEIPNEDQPSQEGNTPPPLTQLQEETLRGDELILDYPKGQPIPIAPIYTQKKKDKVPPKTLRTDRYLYKKYTVDPTDTFQLNKLLNSKLQLSLREIILYSNRATQVLYSRIANDSTFVIELKGVYSKIVGKLAEDLGARSALSQPNKGGEDPITTVRAYRATVRVTERVTIDPNLGRDLYDSSIDVKLTFNENFGVVPSIYVPIRYRPRRVYYELLINEGAETLVILYQYLKAISIRLSPFGKRVQLSSIRGRVDFLGYYKGVEIDIFGVTITIPFLIYIANSPILLSYPQTRKVRLASKNYNNSSQESKISTLAEEIIIFTGFDGRTSLRELDSVIGKDQVSRN